MKLSNCLFENEKIIKEILQNCSDIVFRDITISRRTRILLVFVDGMIDTDIITSNILRPLIYDGLPQGLGTIDSVANMFEQELISALQTRRLSKFDEIVEQVLKGSIAILADGETVALVADIAKFETRSIEDPSKEPSIRGPKQGFTELVGKNMVMLRRILATPRLKFESFKVGEVTHTDIVVSYVEGIVSTSVLSEVRRRLNRIHIDAVLECGYIEESIEDTHVSPFPQMDNTERPDVVAAGLLRGKVAIMCNGSACALMVPMTFWDGLQAPDDNYERFLFIFFIRWVRYIFICFSVIFPSIYIALTDYHLEMVPEQLMMAIATLRERSPFPTVVEVFLMEFTFEGLREAGIRLPKLIGPLVSIVGALVIGDAAVRAGIISAPIVIVVASAGISSFSIPKYSFGYPLRMLRFPLLILSGTFGLLGLAVGIIAILIHLIHLNSFGTPYLTPVAPQVTRRLRDVLLRWPRKRVQHAEPRFETGHR